MPAKTGEETGGGRGRVLFFRTSVELIRELALQPSRMVQQALGALNIGWPSKSWGPTCGFLAHLGFLRRRSGVGKRVRILVALDHDGTGPGRGRELDLRFGVDLQIRDYFDTLGSLVKITGNSLRCAS